jgi:hypothetical protein
MDYDIFNDFNAYQPGMDLFPTSSYAPSNLNFNSSNFSFPDYNDWNPIKGNAYGGEDYFGGGGGSQPSWWDNIKNTAGDFAGSTGFKVGLGATAVMAPFLQRLLGGKTQAEQAQEQYNNWLTQNRISTASDQSTADTKQTEARQWWSDQSKLQPDQISNIMAQYARALATGTQESNKTAAAAGFARAPGKAAMISKLAPSLLQSLTTRNTVPFNVGQTVSTTTPFYQIPTDSSYMSQMIGNIGNIGQYGLGQWTSNLFKTDQQKAMEALYQAMAKRMAGGY